MRYKATPLSVRSASPQRGVTMRRPGDAHQGPRFRDRLSTLLMIALVPVLIVPLFGAGAVTLPTLSVPGEAVAGATLTVTGSDFPKAASIVLTWNGDATGRRIKVSRDGAFSVRFTVPLTAAPGQHALGAAHTPKGKPRASDSDVPIATVSIRVFEATTDASGSPTPSPSPASSPTPTATPSPSPTTTPEPTPSASSAPTPDPTATLVPTIRPAPAPTLTPTPTTPAPTPLPPSSNTSGAAMPAGDLPGWTMVFADDFATDVPLGSFPSAVSSKWWAYPSPWRDTSDKGMYAPEKTVSIADSMMNIWLHTEDGVPLVAAPVPRLPGGGIDQLYGRYAVRFRADPIDGYKTAWLLWPESNVWPRDGEIDFPEGELDGTISAFMHRMNGTSGSDQDAYPTNVGYADWHTAVIEWSPSAVTFILDGTVIGRSTSRIPSTPMHWVLQTETSLTSTYPAPSIQGNVQIDWVVVWRYTP